MDKILVIDDSIVQCEYLRSILCDEFEIVVCQTGRDGLQTGSSPWCFWISLCRTWMAL